MFLHMSVILSTGGVVSQHALQVVSQHALQVSGGLQAHTQGELEVSGQGVLQAHTLGVLQPTAEGVSRPTPKGGLQAHTQGSLQAHTGGISQHALRQTPPHGRLLPRVICILLECILVSFSVPNPYLGKISILTQSVTRED